MAHIRKGILVRTTEWAKHLRPEGKRNFWKKHRAAEAEKTRSFSDMVIEDREDRICFSPRKRKKLRKCFGIEYRYTADEAEHGWIRFLYKDPLRWRKYRWYLTAKRRDEAMKAILKSEWRGLHCREYRTVERD